MSLDGDLASPVFCHVHVPKTGGTTLNVLLGRWFSGHFEILHHSDPNFVLDIGELSDRLARSPALQCISTHCLRSFPAEIGGRPVHYFTILRDPLDRTISTFTHIKKYFDTFSDEHKRLLPSGIERMAELQALKEWTDLTRQDDPSGRLSGNYVTQLFVGDTFRYDFASDRSAGDKAAARQCIDVLERFLHVGDFACFEHSVRTLARRLREFGLSSEVDPLPMENVSSDVRGDMRSLEGGKAIVDAFLEGVAVDAMVYRHFARRASR